MQFRTIDESYNRTSLSLNMKGSDYDKYYESLNNKLYDNITYIVYYISNLTNESKRNKYNM
jgi:hypothetical protein